MSYFKSFELESGHEVLVLKNYDVDTETYIIQTFIEEHEMTQMASISFESEKERNEMFNKYSLEQAKDFADFFIN